MTGPTRWMLLVLLTTTGVAGAEGEYGPMFGGSLVASHETDATELGGVGLELGVWRGRLGVALEGSHLRELGGDDTWVTTVGASARVLVVQHLIPSLLEPRDVELGVELQGIVERAWWEDTTRERDPLRYGLGVAIRLRGGSDDLSNLLAESRLFVRVMASRSGSTALTGSTGFAMTSGDGRELGVVIGLGATFGGGDPDYVQRFRPRPLDTMLAP
jgi:hypothetical protein